MGTRLCIHLSMRGLHQQSSPGWSNQSLLLTFLLCYLLSSPFSPLQSTLFSSSHPCLVVVPNIFTLRFSQMVLSRAAGKCKKRQVSAVLLKSTSTATCQSDALLSTRRNRLLPSDALADNHQAF